MLNLKRTFLITGWLWVFAALVAEGHELTFVGSPHSDTLIIAESGGRVSISKNIPLKRSRLQLIKAPGFDSNSRYVLTFKHLQLKEPPDGTYEIYLSTGKDDTTKLSPESPLFVGVLDTYTQTGKTKETPGLDVTDFLTNVLNRKLPPELFITVRFGGNILPGNIPSQNAGILTIGNIQLVEVK